MTQSSTSDRLWAGIAAIVLLVGILFIVDPFAKDDSDPLLDGVEDGPFVAVLQRDELPSVGPDQVLSKVEDRRVKADSKTVASSEKHAGEIEAITGVRPSLGD